LLPLVAKLLVQGAPADLLLLNRNPLTQIEGARSSEAVVLRGKLLDRAPLDGLLAGPRAAIAAKRECSL
jgi:hypothetical protein